MQLLEPHGLDDAQPPSNLAELDFTAPSWTSNSLDAEKSKLYRGTVGALSRVTLVRPDIGFAVQQLRRSLSKPTENDEVQLMEVLGYLRGTHHYSIKLQPPRRWTRAKSLDLLAFTSASWTGARRSPFGVSLFLMGVPLATSSRQQATGVQAAEFASVGLACALAAHTKILLQELRLDKPMGLRVLTGGSLAMQLGLSKHNRHVELCSLFGQFQLSKVQVHQDLAAYLTYNPPASGLHWLLPKLRMHIKIVEARALPTRLCEKEAFFLGSPCSFYIGVISLTPMMAQLDLAQLERPASEELTLTAYARQLWGKEPEKPNNIPELQLALLTQTSLQRKELAKMKAKSLEKTELERTALQMNLDSLLRKSLRKEELTAERACPLMAQSFPAKPDEGWRASAYNCAALIQTAFRTQLWELELDKKNNIPQLHLQLCPSPTQGGALKSSSRKQLRMTSSHRLSFTRLLSIFMILMVSSLTLTSLSLPSSFRTSMKNELAATCWNKEVEKPHELRNLLGDQELEELLVDKSFPLDHLHDHLGKENLWSVQLQQNLLENEKNKKKKKKKKKKKQLETKNEFHQSFENMILKKLVALLLEWHFAKAASTQLLGNEAWAKYREASQKIIFKKTLGDKVLPHQLRREQLDCKDLRSDSFRALCPTSFEENNFAEHSFNEETFKEETFTESTFDREELTDSSFTASSLTDSSLTDSSLTENSFTKSSLTKKSFDNNSFSENTFSENSFDKSTFKEETFQEATFPEESFHDSSLKEETFSDTSFEEETFSESSFENSSFNQSSLEESSFTKSSFPTSSLEESSFEQSSFEENTFNKSSFDQHSFTACSFNKSSFEESRFGTSSFDKHSFTKSSLAQSSLQPNSFEDSSSEDSSFQEDSLDKASFQRTALTTELAQLQRRTSTTELAKLERRTLTLELAELDSTALHTELEQLEEPVFRRAASSLELSTAHFAVRSLATLCGPGSLTIRAQGGVLSIQLLTPYQLDRDQLDLGALPPWLKLAWSLSEKRASPLQA